MTERMKYVGPAGEVIVLEVPWGDGTGWIPPPTIEFRNTYGGAAFVFECRGTED